METKRSRAYRTVLLVHVLLLDVLLFFATWNLSSSAWFSGFSPAPYLTIGGLAAAGLLSAAFRALYFLPSVSALALAIVFSAVNPWYLQGWRAREFPILLVLDLLFLATFTVLVFVEERRARMET